MGIAARRRYPADRALASSGGPLKLYTLAQLVGALDEGS